MMPLSFPPMRQVLVDGVTEWQATCRACGQDVCERPQLVKAAVEEARRHHGFEANCTRTPVEPEVGVHPCDQHHGILNPSFPWERALQVADECADCEVTR